MRLLIILIFTLWTFDLSVNGYSVRRKRIRRALPNIFGDNVYSILDILGNLNSQQQIKRTNVKRTNSGQYTSQPRLKVGSSALSGVPGCSECFLGLQVSRREAVVVSKWMSIINFKSLFLLDVNIKLIVLS